MKRRFTFLMAAFALLVFMMPIKDGWGQTRDSYSQEYGYSDLKELLPANGNWSDAGTYIKIPSASGGSESFTIPIDADKQPVGNISLTLELATYGGGNAPAADNGIDCLLSVSGGIGLSCRRFHGTLRTAARSKQSQGEMSG